MAGTDSRFSADKFRNGIRFAMEMGFPEDSNQRLTWHWTPERTFVNPDSTGFPLEWTAANQSSEISISDLVVDVAVKFQQAGGQTRVGGTGLGIFDIATVTATLLDEDFDLIMAHSNNRFPDQAIIDGDVYIVQIVQPPVGLFEVTIYQVILQAIDET